MLFRSQRPTEGQFITQRAAARADLITAVFDGGPLITGPLGSVRPRVESFSQTQRGVSLFSSSLFFNLFKSSVISFYVHSVVASVFRFFLLAHPLIPSLLPLLVTSAPFLLLSLSFCLSLSLSLTPPPPLNLHL